jgi:hypothetical protein
MTLTTLAAWILAFALLTKILAVRGRLGLRRPDPSKEHGRIRVDTSRLSSQYSNYHVRLADREGAGGV